MTNTPEINHHLDCVLAGRCVRECSANTPTEKCCEKCWDPLGFDGQKIGCCVNRACPCHSPTENSWEERFENEFKVRWTPDSSQYFEGGIPPWPRDIKSFIQNIEQEAYLRGRNEERDHLRFLYRWISRLNGDKPHDRPETDWKSYVQAMVCYPLSPWQTGDWFEEELTEATLNERTD